MFASQEFSGWCSGPQVVTLNGQRQSTDPKGSELQKHRNFELSRPRFCIPYENMWIGGGLPEVKIQAAAAFGEIRFTAWTEPMCTSQQVYALNGLLSLHKAERKVLCCVARTRAVSREVHLVDRARAPPIRNEACASPARFRSTSLRVAAFRRRNSADMTVRPRCRRNNCIASTAAQANLTTILSNLSMEEASAADDCPSSGYPASCYSDVRWHEGGSHFSALSFDDNRTTNVP